MKYGIRLFFTLAMLASAWSIPCAAAIQFAGRSRLAEGRWVKIRTADTGIYEISYDKLREMGFADPSKVGVYGTGDSMRPDNFTSASGERLYADDLPAIPVFHAGGKLYFYGRGPEKIRLQMSADADAPYFSRVSRNIYSANGFYFLAEGRADANIITRVETAEESGSGFSLYDYIYHEADLQQNYNESGQLFFGESFLPAASRTMQIPFNLPLADLATPASLECQFMQKSDKAGSTLTFGFGNGSDMKVTATISEIPAGTYYTYQTASPSAGKLRLPGSKGNITLKYTPKGSPEGANLDYVLAGYRKTAGFQNDEPQCRGYVGREGLAAGAYIMASAPADAVVWRIDNSGRVHAVPSAVTAAGDIVVAFDSAVPGGEILVAFSPSAVQKEPDSWTEVANQNLHATQGADLVIITEPQYAGCATRLAELNKAYDGSEVVYAFPEEIYNEFSEGIPDPMAYRTFIKMVYDRSGGRLRNVLLLGDQRSDMLQADKPLESGGIIAFQTIESNRYESTYGVNDIYGMMNDNYPDAQSGRNIYQREMQLGVASLPVHSQNECDIITDKIARFMTDDSFPYWMTDNLYLGDTGDDDVHPAYCDDIAVRAIEYTGNTLVGQKIYANNYAKGLGRTYFRQAFDRGAMHTLYFGHGGINGVSHFFSGIDVPQLRNNRLGFMAVAGCEIAGLDRVKRGTPEQMLLSTRYGLIGALLSTRTAWSNQNKTYMNHFTTAMYSAAERAQGPRTIGEIYARSKTLSKVANEFVYHLFGYPGLRYPVPTEECVTTSVEGDGVSVAEGEYTLAAGTTVRLQGEVRDAAGNLLPDYNGRIVAKIYAAPHEAELQHILVSSAEEPMTFTYDEQLIGMTEGRVTDGRYDIELSVPALVSDGQNRPSVRLATYNPADHRAAAGILRFVTTVPSGSGGSTTSDTEAPAISGFGLKEGVPGHIWGSPVLLAEISDNTGVRLGSSDLAGGTRLLLDGKVLHSDLTAFATASDGGRAIKMEVPLEDMTTGRHTALLEVRDYAGNMSVATAEISINPPEAKQGSLTMLETALFDTATFRYDGGEPVGEARLYVVDRTGETVFSAPVSAAGVTWDGRKPDGSRAVPGIYSAHVSGVTAGGKVFASPKTDFVVFSAKK